MTKLFKLKEGFKLNSDIKMVLTEIAVFFLGFFLMDIRFIFGIYPFGLAYLASQRRYTVFAFCGCLLSVIFKMGFNVVYVIALCAILGLRIVGSLIQRKEKSNSVLLGINKESKLLDSLFCENEEVRVAICAFCAFGIGVYRVIASNYSYYECFVLVFSTILCGILTYALSLNKKRELSVKYAVLVFAILFSIKELEIFSINVSMVLSYGLVLYASKHLGGIKAGAFGLLLGLSQSILYSPVFSIGGIVSGLLWGISPFIAIMSGFALALGLGVFAGGYDALASCAPELLFVSLIMYPLLRFKMIPVPEFIREGAKDKRSIDTLILEARDKRDKDRLSLLSSAFEDIAELIRGESERSKSPTRDDYSALCLEACEDFCYQCPKHSICWDKDISTTNKNIERLSNELFAQGYVSTLAIESKFLHRCPHIEDIIGKINYQKKERLKSGVKNNKLEVASYDYEQISRLLCSTQGQQIKDEYIDTQLSERLERMCAKIGLECDEIKAIGIQSKEIIATGVNVDRTKCTIEQLRKALCEVVGLPISTPTFSLEGSYATMHAYSTNCFSTKEHFDSYTKEGESVNGDTSLAFDGLNGHRYMLLCDGMGSGEEASFTSCMCASFLEKILKITNEKEIALSMLNSLLRANGAECSSTIDLLDINLVTGKGSFVKSGASPSYIKRGDKVFKLESKTMPVGIMKELDAEELSFELREGDICIMLSDGVANSKEDGDKIMSLLRELDTESLDTLPTKILKSMKKHSTSNDDMSVCVAQICA